MKFDYAKNGNVFISVYLFGKNIIAPVHVIS